MEILVKSEFPFPTSSENDQNGLPKEAFSLSLGTSTLTESMNISCVSLSYPDYSHKWPVLPSIQSHPIISQEISSNFPTVKTEPMERPSAPGDSMRPQSPSSFNAFEFEKLSKAPPLLSTENTKGCDSTKCLTSLQESGRISPSSVSERSLPSVKRESSTYSVCGDDSDTSGQNVSQGDCDVDDIDFESVCYALDNASERNIHNFYPTSTTSTSEPLSASINAWQREMSISTSSSSNIDQTSMSSGTVPLIKRTRVVALDDDFYPIPISNKRSRRISSIVPNPRKSRNADYQCSKCGEGYQRVVDENSWWAVYVHECPHCRESQVPRIDINAGPNAIELDPNMIALYGEGSADSDNEEDEDSEYEYMSDDDDMDLDNNNIIHTIGGAYSPSSSSSSSHNQSQSSLLEQINTDCPCVASPSISGGGGGGRSSGSGGGGGGDCVLSWCLPVKKMLFHLTHCQLQNTCAVCTPCDLPNSFRDL
eukprot:gene5795-11698_t